MTYERYMHDRFFVPAGMMQTGYTIPRWDPSRVAHTYTLPVDHASPLDRLRASRGPWWMLMGNGGMLTTTGDIYRWELALRAGRPVSRAVQATQFAPHFDRGPTLSQGYDWWLERTEGDRIMYHRGGDAPSLGLNAEYRRYPGDGSTIILLANTRHNGGSTRRFIVPNLRRILIDDHPPALPTAVPGSPASLKKYVGSYTIDSTSRIAITVDRDHLVLSADGQRAVDLLLFNRDSTSLASRRRLDDRALEFVNALARGPLERLSTWMDGDTAAARRMRSYWQERERQHGTFQSASVLGTARLDRAVFLTTVRLAFARDTVAVRFSWSAQGRPTLDSDDQALPKFAAFVRYAPVSSALVAWYWWPTGDNEIVTYDLFTDQALSASFTTSATGDITGLVVHTPGRDVRLARRPSP